ncbi:MAG: hypothetical protein MRERV_19c028 [Mycoplasmataceae bacterium RV_VA103A]|nr:MAG: hypothetical protein MRERV_19c028 [Mycoplasmataceae bacterium RV_VA103A]
MLKPKSFSSGSMSVKIIQRRKIDSDKKNKHEYFQ